MICSIVCLSGFSILASASKDQLTSKFLPSWILLSLGGSGLHITGFHFTNLFDGDGKRKASAFISAAFGASSAVFPIMQVFNQYGEVPMQTMMQVYTVLVGLIVVNNLFVQPWSKLQRGKPYKANFDILNSGWWKRDLGQKPTLSLIVDDAFSFDFIGEAIIFSVLLLLLTHYLSTSAQLLYEKGDIPFTSNANDWSDYVIARMAGWFNAMGFIWLPIGKQMLTRLQWPQLFSFLCFINIVIVGIVLVKNLEVQILGFALLSFGRLMLFSCHHAYLIDTFGMTNFGTLNGISSFLAAILGFCSYPLQLFALRTNFALSFVPIGILVLLSMLVPLVFYKRQKKSENATHHTTANTFHDLEGDTKKTPSITNWAETVSVDQSLFRYPKTVEDVVQLVNSHSKIRCAGALHSCAPLIESEGIIMSMIKLEKIISIDPDNMTVLCQSGARIHDICDAIAPYNMALGTLGTIDWQTISGAVMTGT